MERFRATFLLNGGWGRLTGLLAGASLLFLGPAVLAVEVDRVVLCEDASQSGSTECDGADIRFQQDISATRQYGFSVAMGYLNGDNFADVVIGDPGESRVYVFFGGVNNASPAEDLNDRTLENADFVLFLGTPDAGLGSSIAIGTLNTISNDMIVGAPAIDDASQAGAAYVIDAGFWASNPPQENDIEQIAIATLRGEQAGEQAGYSVAMGPVLSAGTDDFVVGARLAQESRGRVYAVSSAVTGDFDLGTATMVTGVGAAGPDPDDPDRTSADALGEYLAIADFVIGGDGIDEIAIGAVGTPPDETTNIGGRVYLVDVSGGNIDLAMTDVRTIQGVNTNDFFGFTLVAGDFDGNGRPDLVAGAIYADREVPDCATDEKNAGALYYFDNLALQGTATTSADAASKILWGFRKWDELGFGLAAGDVNNDLDTDLIASARSHDRNLARFDEVNEGAAYVFHGGPASIFTTATMVCLDCTETSCDPLPTGVDAMLFGGDYDIGSSTSEQVGFSLAAGDFNGNSLFDDIVLSSTAHDRAYLVTLVNTDGTNTNPEGQATDDYRDIRDRDDDGDGYTDVEEDENLDGIVNGVESDPLVPNRDVAVSITTPGTGAFNCNDVQTVTTTVTNSGLLALNDPQLEVTLPGALQSGGVRPVYRYVPGTTVVDGTPVADLLLCQDTLAACVDNGDCASEDICGVMPFTTARSLTADGNPLPTPLLSTESIGVAFDIRANVKIEIGTDTADTVDAEVTLDPTEDPDGLDPASPLAGERQASAPVSLNLPLLSIIKTSTDVNDAPLEPEDVLRYTITLANPGGAAPALNVLVSDAIPAKTLFVAASSTCEIDAAACPGGTVTEPANPSGGTLTAEFPTLAIGSTAIITFDVKVDQEQINQGDTIDNTAVASEDCVEDKQSDTSDAVTVDTTIAVTNVPVPNTLVEPGGTVDYNVTVTNQGNIRLAITSMLDDLYGDVTDPGNLTLDSTNCTVPTDIDPGGSYNCTFVVFLGGRDADDVIEDTVTVVVETPTGVDTDSGAGLASVTITDLPPSVAVIKTALPTTVDEPGGDVTFTVRVINQSVADTVTVTRIEDDEDNDGTVDVTYQPTICVDAELAPGEATDCTFTRFVGGDPGDTITDNVTVTMLDDDNEDVIRSATATVTVVDVPSSLAVVKTATPDNVDEPGGLVDFTVTVTNTSPADTVTLTSIEDDEDNDGTVDQTYDPAVDCNATVLAPTEVAICTFSHAVNGNAGDTITDAVTVFGTDDDVAPVSGGATATVTINELVAAITVVKTATPDNVDEPGGLVNFTVTVTNDSVLDTVTLTSIEDDEDNDGTVDQTYDPAVDCSATVLAPTEVAICTFSHVVNGNAGDTITDAVTVFGTDDDVAPVSGGATATVTVNDVPSSIAVVKTATPDTVPDPGGNVTFGVLVTNTSLVDTVTLTFIEEDETDDGTVDSILPLTECDSVELLPTEVATCSFDRVVAGTAGETFTDRVTITGEDDDGGPVSGDATATVTIGPPPIGPPDQLNLVSTGGSQFEWNPTGSAASYHLYRGDMQELISTGAYAQDPAEVPSAARMCWLSQPQYDDDFVPEAGAVVFYLVTFDDGLSEGDLGYARQNANPCRQ